MSESVVDVLNNSKSSLSSSLLQTTVCVIKICDADAFTLLLSLKRVTYIEILFVHVTESQLNAFRESNGAWKLALYFLKHTQNDNVKIYVLNVLEVCVYIVVLFFTALMLYITYGCKDLASNHGNFCFAWSMSVTTFRVNIVWFC